MRVITLWLKKNPPAVYETAFAYRYCYQKTIELLSTPVLSIAEKASVGSVQALLKKKGAQAALVVTDPETVISPKALEILCIHSSNADLVGPMFNETTFPAQQVILPFPYLDAFTFVETAAELAKEHGKKTVAVSALDPTCFLLTAKTLAQLPSDILLEEIPALPGLTKLVALGALVHRFGNYYASAREDLVALVPKEASKILDIGCAKGGFGHTLKKRRPGIYLVGVELNTILAKKALQIYDLVITDPIEKACLPHDFDLVNMGDVLEHLYDPWEVLSKIARLLRPGGWLIGSVPNANHWTILRQLLLGEFEYIPVGLLCISHIRFFTEKTLKKALREAGFVLETLEHQKFSPTPEGKEFIQKLLSQGLGDEESLLTAELVFRAQKK